MVCTHFSKHQTVNTIFTTVFLLLTTRPPQTAAVFELTIVHTNDVHARIEEFSERIGTCPPTQYGKCYGGVARRFTAIEEIRRREKNVVLLDAGDQYMGTMWYDHYKGDAARTFMNMMKYDAMVLGNHEFDHGPQYIHPFIREVNFPVVTANVDFREQPGWPSDPKFHLKSTVLKVGNVSIGVIGYVAPETEHISSPGPHVKFCRIIRSVKRELRKLKKQGIKIFIALGHGGIAEDKDVAEVLDDIDVVVGGHSHTFLYSGPPPSNEVPEGPYPIVFNDTTTRLVVQDYAFGKYLGFLKVTFDDDGNILKYKGNPILLDSSFAEDPVVLKKVKRMSRPVREKRNNGVGFTSVVLDGDRNSCRQQECNMGNMIADAIAELNQIALGLWNSGSIRASIEKPNKTVGISYEELYKVSPFANTADIVHLKGHTLREVFEHSVSALPKKKGRFLQVSGFRVKFDVSRPVGKRVVKLEALCSGCIVSTYEDVVGDKWYTVVTSNYIIDGGDGFKMLAKHKNRHTGEDVLTLLESYMSTKSPVSPKVEGRITFVNDVNEDPSVSRS